MNPTFLRVVGKAFKKLKVKKVYVYSHLRKSNSSSYHSKGQALDIGYIVFENGKILYLNVKFQKYDTLQDLLFFNALFNELVKYNIEYYSPAKIFRTGKYNQNNKYKSLSQKGKREVLSKAGKPHKKYYELNSWHLDHLHLAIDVSGNKVAVAGASFILFATALGFLGYKYYQKKIKAKNPELENKKEAGEEEKWLIE
ncbi:MAG: hypothetical protein AAF518_14520 [Spirochaetota bacterium]